MKARSNDIKAVINGIWFSPDGSVRASVIDNLVKIKADIDAAGYENEYQVCLWTDASILDPQARHVLEQNGIVIKDYRDINCTDEKSIKLMRWIDRLVKLGNEKDKLPYAMAADTLRLFLLLKVYPDIHPEMTGIYIDCNDIRLKNIPDPETLRRRLAGSQTGLALNPLKYQFNTDLVYEIMPMINNDVILAYRTGHEIEFDEFLDCHLNNLEYMNAEIKKRTGHGFIRAYRKSQHIKENSDDIALAEAIEFGIPHTFNVYVCHAPPKVYLYNWGAAIQVRPVEIESAVSYFEIEHHKEEGLTWAPKTGQKRHGLFDNVSPDAAEKSGFWKQLFHDRNNMVTAFRKLHESGIPFSPYEDYLRSHPDSAVFIAEGAILLHHDASLARLYQEILSKWESEQHGYYFSSADNVAQCLARLQASAMLNDLTSRLVADHPYHAHTLASSWTGLSEMEQDLPHIIIQISDDHPVQMLAAGFKLLGYGKVERDETLYILRKYSSLLDKNHGSQFSSYLNDEMDMLISMGAMTARTFDIMANYLDTRFNASADESHHDIDFVLDEKRIATQLVGILQQSSSAKNTQSEEMLEKIHSDPLYQNALSVYAASLLEKMNFHDLKNLRVEQIKSELQEIAQPRPSRRRFHFD
ncbi:hypothetical protein AQUSIP_08300 [Aquicella siphonis]|uniref:Uncharacterized protein n=1 Tax=Aquicella siphonis TaxID=254247 RepID=A0A5E4PEY1_9COXI|nr:hypothetical protein [Aquicella siphonis]VVC75540.1 hypothetical protein AQUSIP_08300 [Aquicella siphonis]